MSCHGYGVIIYNHKISQEIKGLIKVPYSNLTVCCEKSACSTGNLSINETCSIVKFQKGRYTIKLATLDFDKPGEIFHDTPKAPDSP